MTTKATPEEIFGYKVEVGDIDSEVPYTLIGKRGARYNLVRYQNLPKFMFVLNSHGNIVGLKGNYQFRDDGEEGLRVRTMY